VDAVIWHDVECGSYAADLPLWRELADAHGGPVLDLGAGTGRVALDLATRGHTVHALDVDAALLEALKDRAAGLPVVTHLGDARDFTLDATFGLVLAPMQTLQLLGGPAARGACLRAVRRHLAPGGVFASALADAVDTYGEIEAPVPDLREVAGVVFSSRPIAVRDDGDGFVLERLRERVAVDGSRTVTEDRIRLDRLSPDRFEAEARRAGFTVAPRRTIAETDDHVGSEVVVLRA
jgi:SAM-dependent methyltransferase